MAKEYIETKYKNKKGEVKTKKYRIDAEFVPATLDDIHEEFIQNWCIQNGQEAWLDEQYATMVQCTVKKETRKYHGKEYKQGESFEMPKPFMSIRKDFAEKFFNIRAKGDEKADSRTKWANKKKLANKK